MTEVVEKKIGAMAWRVCGIVSEERSVVDLSVIDLPEHGISMIERRDGQRTIIHRDIDSPSIEVVLADVAIRVVVPAVLVGVRRYIGGRTRNVDRDARPPRSAARRVNL